MTVVKEPVKVYTNVPEPVRAPIFRPVRQPVEATPERELVPVRVKPAQQRL